MKPNAVDTGPQVEVQPSPVYLRYALIALFMGCAGFMVLLRAMAPEQSSRYIGPALGAGLAVLAGILVEWGKPRLAIQLLATGAWTLATLISIFNGGVRTPVVIGFPVIIMLIGWLFSARAAVVTGALTVGVLGGMLWAEAAGILPQRPLTPPAMYAVVQVLFTVLAVFLVNFLVRSYRTRLQELAVIAANLAQRTQELEITQARLDTALESTRMVLWEYDLAADQMRYEQTRLALLGINTVDPPRDLAAWLACVHPDDQPLFMAGFAQATALGNTPFDVDYRLQDRSGGWVWVHTRGTVIKRDSNGLALLAAGGTVNISERKQAQEAAKRSAAELAISRKLLRTIIDTAPIRVFWKDRNLRYLGCNPAFARDAGVNHEDELIGKLDTELVWKDQAPMYNADDRQVMISGIGKFAYDEPQTTPDGRQLWLRTSKVPLKNEAGQVVGVLGVFEDITQRRQAQAALRDSENRTRELAGMLRLMCDNVPDMIWAKDLNRRFIFANKALCNQLLCTNDTSEPIGKDDMFFAQRQRQLHPENQNWHTFGELCQDSDAATLQNGRASQFDEYGNVRGEFLYLDVHKAPFLDEHGKVIGVVGSARNVTRQKVDEERLLLAALVLEQSSEALMITDASDRVVEINPAFTRLTGYDRAEILGQIHSLFNLERQSSDVFLKMQKSLEEQGQWQGEIWNRCKNGELKAEWLTINTLYGENGSIHRRVALLSDITEKKKSEDLLWKHANYDMLTQLPNRRMFHERLKHETEKRNRSGLKLALFYLDLDRFKEVNDSLGHNKGDLLLMQAAQRIVACVRSSDMVARLGGDEFTVILTEISQENSVDRVSQSIVLALSQPFEIDSDRVEVSASIGIAMFPHDATDPQTLLKMADQAMYAAKNAGRNRVMCWTEDLRLHAP